MKRVSIKLYIATLALTAVVFISAFFISNYLNRRKTDELKAEEDKITVDILSFETQVGLLKSSSCQDFSGGQLESELQDLQSRLSYMESQVGPNDPDLSRLKRYYALLEINDYVLAKQMSTECKQNTVFILYFYGDNSCSQCQAQSYMLQAVEQKYPTQVQEYSFDFDLDLSAVETLVTLHNLPSTPPVIDINGTSYPPFATLADMENVVDALVGTSTMNKAPVSAANTSETTTKKN